MKILVGTGHMAKETLLESSGGQTKSVKDCELSGVMQLMGFSVKGARILDPTCRYGVMELSPGREIQDLLE